MFMSRNWFLLIILIVGMIVLQVFLSKRENKWPGIVLPAISFIFSLIMVLNVANVGDWTSVLSAIFLIFLLCNIPTLVLFAIYFGIRSGKKRKAELEKMNIQDLK